MRWLFLFVLVLNFAYVGWEMSQPEEVVDTPIVDSKVPRIILLSELGQESVASPVNKSAAISSDHDDKEDVAVTGGCYTLGPFRDLGKLRAVTRGIKSYVVEASYRSHEEKEHAMFWVFLKPVADYSHAKILADSLKKKKVSDYFIIKSGLKKNGISLGHFRDKDRAYNHSAHIKTLGFESDVEAIFKDYTIYWLDYEVDQGKNIPESLFEKHLTGKINRLLREC